MDWITTIITPGPRRISSNRLPLQQHSRSHTIKDKNQMRYLEKKSKCIFRLPGVEPSVSRPSGASCTVKPSGHCGMQLVLQSSRKGGYLGLRYPTGRMFVPLSLFLSLTLKTSPPSEAIIRTICPKYELRCLANPSTPSPPLPIIASERAVKPDTSAKRHTVSYS